MQPKHMKAVIEHSSPNLPTHVPANRMTGTAARMVLRQGVRKAFIKSFFFFFPLIYYERERKMFIQKMGS
jgi:hypothetical protein